MKPQEQDEEEEEVNGRREQEFKLTHNPERSPEGTKRNDSKKEREGGAKQREDIDE